jgi:hypothetical protein
MRTEVCLFGVLNSGVKSTITSHHNYNLNVNCDLLADSLKI